MVTPRDLVMEGVPRASLYPPVSLWPPRVRTVSEAARRGRPGEVASVLPAWPPSRKYGEFSHAT